MGDGKQESIWCVVANVTSEPHSQGPDCGMRLGTKNFAPGTKLYCFPPMWGDGGDRIQVIGHHRGSARFITVIMPTKRLTNWRAKQVYDPYIIKAMKGYWDCSEASETETRELAEAFRNRSPRV